MDSAFLQKLLSYVQPTAGIGPLSAKVYYANTSGNWYNSTSRIGGYTAKTTGLTASTVAGGKDTASGDTLIDWGSQLGSQWTSTLSFGASTQFGSDDILGCAYGAGLYVAVASNAKAASSPDGVTWTSRTTNFGTDHHRGVFFGGSQFVAVGNNGKLSTSPDGITWTSQTSSFGATTIRLGTYGASTYVTVGDSGKTATSSDAVTWTQQTNTFSTSTIFGVAYGAGLFVAVGDSGKLSTSPDGVTWTSRTSSFSTTPIVGVDFGGGKFVAVGNTGKIATSPDGITWTQQTSPTTNNLSFVRYLAGEWVCGGGSGTIMVSPDGITWTNYQTTTPFYATGPVSVWACASNGTDLVATGGTGTAAISQAGAFINNTTLAGVIVDLVGAGTSGSLLPFSDASTPFYSAGTPPPSITVGQITLAFGGQPQYFGDYVADTILAAVDNGIAADPGYLTTAATCRLLSTYTSPTSFTEITTAQYSSYARQACAISVTGSTLSNTGSLFFTIYGSSPTAPTITHAAIFDNLDRVIMCLPLPTPIARTDYIRDITIAAGAMQLNLNPTQTSTPV